MIRDAAFNRRTDASDQDFVSEDFYREVKSSVIIARNIQKSLTNSKNYISLETYERYIFA